MEGEGKTWQEGGTKGNWSDWTSVGRGRAAGRREREQGICKFCHWTNARETIGYGGGRDWGGGKIGRAALVEGEIVQLWQRDYS